MRFIETTLNGVILVYPEPVTDERGFFSRTFCTAEFDARGLSFDVAQCSISFNQYKGVLRGMHFQATPHAEDKLVRCTGGAIFDAVVDVRRASRTYGQWFGAELTAENRHALFIPKGFAHGFLTLTDASEVLYMISTPFAPGAARGLIWNDPAVGIAWPDEPSVISDRDRNLASLADLAHSEVG